TMVTPVVLRPPPVVVAVLLVKELALTVRVLDELTAPPVVEVARLLLKVLLLIVRAADALRAPPEEPLLRVAVVPSPNGRPPIGLDPAARLMAPPEELDTLARKLLLVMVRVPAPDWLMAPPVLVAVLPVNVDPEMLVVPVVTAMAPPTPVEVL